MTVGSIGAANSHDLDSMAVLAVGTVAWMAYGWLTLAVLATVLVAPVLLAAPAGGQVFRVPRRVGDPEGLRCRIGVDGSRR